LSKLDQEEVPLQNGHLKYLHWNTNLVAIINWQYISTTNLGYWIL